jgi:tetratricopeptide (TPR) repeat protein
VDRLSKKLRRRVGESLRSLRRDPPLERVTTGSLEALRKYTAATRAVNAEGDLEKGIVLLQEAIALDSGFAMAHQALGTTLTDLGKEPERRLQALTKAFQYRDRLPERERYVVQGNYYQSVTFEPEKSMAAYRALLERYPDDWEGLNQLGWLNMIQGQQARAQELFRRAIALDSSKYPPYDNLIVSQLADGKRADAERTMQRVLQRFPDSPDVVWNASDLASSGGDYAAAEAYARRLAERYGDNAYYRANAADHLARLAAIRGQLAEAERHARDAMQIVGEAGDTGSYFRYATLLGAVDVRLRRDPERGLHEVEQALARFPLDSMKPFDRMYLTLAEFYALAGKPERARMLVKEFERLVAPPLRRWDEAHRHAVVGQTALAEGHLQEAIEELSQAPTNGPLCPLCGLAALGIAYDLAGKRDSAIVAYERYVTTPWLYRVMQDGTQLAGVYKRLGELYEARGDREKAAQYYSRFIELWKDCDPELRPEVVEAQRRLASLGREPAK